jgi:hypothetical protein
VHRGILPNIETTGSVLTLWVGSVVRSATRAQPRPTAQIADRLWLTVCGCSCTVVLAPLAHVRIITLLFPRPRGTACSRAHVVLVCSRAHVVLSRNAFVNVGSDAQILKPLVQPSTTVASLLLTTPDPPDVGGTMQLLLRQVAHRVEYWMDTIEEEVGGYCGLQLNLIP